jgi:hypothetical protein
MHAVRRKNIFIPYAEIQGLHKQIMKSGLFHGVFPNAGMEEYSHSFRAIGGFSDRRF